MYICESNTCIRTPIAVSFVKKKNPEWNILNAHSNRMAKLIVLYSYNGLEQGE